MTPSQRCREKCVEVREVSESSSHPGSNCEEEGAEGGAEAAPIKGFQVITAARGLLTFSQVTLLLPSTK